MTQFLSYERDPTWYRVLYALSVHRLLAAPPRPEYGEAPPAEDPARELPRLGERATAVVEKLPSSPDQEGDFRTSMLADAERNAAELLGVTSVALARSGRPWVGTTPAWFIRLKPSLSPARRPDLAEFLERVVEPAATVLLMSIRVERAAPAASLARQLARSALNAIDAPVIDRRRGAVIRRDSIGRDETAVDVPGDWLSAYLELLICTRSESWPRSQRILGWLGAARFTRPAPTSHRVHYNLACLLCRLARSFLAADESDMAGKLATAAAEELRRALRLLPRGPARTRLAEWAKSDPGLDGLRVIDSHGFDRIIALG